MQVFCHLENGQHDGLERNKHRHNAQEIDDRACSGFRPCQFISGDGGDQNDPCQAQDRNHGVVQEQPRVVDEIPNVRVILEHQGFRKRNDVGHDLGEAF
ncbi:hypothetical protein D3C76_1407590 [compost metagenome]